jgi:hypothetical protein
MTNLGRINDAKLFCPVSGPNATTGANPVNLENLEILSN